MVSIRLGIRLGVQSRTTAAFWRAAIALCCTAVVVVIFVITLGTVVVVGEGIAMAELT